VRCGPVWPNVDELPRHLSPDVPGHHHVRRRAGLVEATSDRYPGTVPGALLSGRLAARQVEGVAPSAAAVLVVGSGIAGLAAAAHLQVTGHHVTVLEARDRLGGRIWTSRDLGPPVELGALGIDGARGNPLTRVADRIAANRLTTDPHHTVTYDVSGAPLKPAAAPVHRIDYDDAGVTVTTAQGVTHADYAVVTLPLGVLQSGSVVFAPELPDPKRQAIAALGTGLVNRVVLQFPHVFWDRNAEIIGHVDAQKGRWARWVNLASYTGAPILLGVNAASYARELETRTQPQVVADAMDVLGSIYG
jgi:monoamine oxidase